MPAGRRKQRRPKLSDKRLEPSETRAAEVLTIAWTVSVTGAFIADLMMVGAHFLACGNPGVAALSALEGLLMLSAATMGAISLVLLGLVWNKRQLKPPQGYVLFAFVVAAAPIATALAKLLG